MTALLLDVAARSSALIAGAALVHALLRRRGSAAARHLVWTMTMAALVVLPLASSVLPRWEIAIPVPSTVTSIAPQPISLSSDLRLRTSDVPSSARPSSARPSSARRATEGGRATEGKRLTLSATTVLSTLYIAGVLILLVRIAMEPLALRRLTRAAHVVTNGAWRTLLEDAARQMCIDRPVRLLQSADDIMPMTFGTRRPTIMVPASAGTWTEDRQRAVLLHELAHVARRDCFTQLIGSIACAVYWPHPGVWWAARRLRVERELACDDRVIAAGTEPRDYAGHLLEIAHSFAAMPAPATALGMARARQLENRLLAIMDAARNRAALHHRGRAIAIALSLAALLPIAALRAAIVGVDVTGTPDLPHSSGAAPQARASGAADVTGSWDARLQQDGTSVQLNIRHANSSHGRTVPLAQLQGLTGVDIASARGPVTFTSKREAGTFTFDGTCRSGACGGTWGFEANPAFAADLAKRGIGAPTAQQQFKLAVADVGTAYLDELAKQGYGKPDLTGLVRAADHGVTLDYLRGMGDLGYKVATLDALVQLRDHGVDPQFVRGMTAAGYGRLSADDLQRARDHGADPEFAGGMASLGYKNLPLDALIGARDHGVDPQYVRGMQSLGYSGLSLDDLTRTRDHGVDPEYARGLSSLGYTGVPLETLIEMRDHGVDPEYVRGLAALGYKGLPLDTLRRMRDHGVDPDFVRRVQRGSGNLTPEQLIDRRDRGGDPSA